MRSYQDLSSQNNLFYFQINHSLQISQRIQSEDTAHTGPVL